MCYKYLKPPKKCCDYTEQVADYCEHCGRDIYVGEEYYDVDGITICHDCINDYRKTAKSKE